MIEGTLSPRNENDPLTIGGDVTRYAPPIQGFLLIFSILFLILSLPARCEQPSPESLLAAAIEGGNYLVRHQNVDGSFHYIYYPDRDDYSSSYNLLRHAGTCYSLLELYEVTEDATYLEAGKLGLEWLLTRTRGPKPEDLEADFLTIVSPDQEAKLGGAGLATIALCKYESLTADTNWRPICREFFHFIRFMQDDAGQFESKYFYGEPDKVKFVSMYYPGEAILSLCRLYQLDPDPEYLKVATQGADWLIDVRDKGKTLEDLPHDHWFLMALNELHELTHDDRYLEQAKKIAGAILLKQRGPKFSKPEWAGTFYTPPRSTPCSIRGEALAAMINLAGRNNSSTEEYQKSLELIARFVMSCQIRKEESQNYPNPPESLGGIKKSLEDPHVRIDYVQHAISMMLGLRRVLIEGAPID